MYNTAHELLGEYMVHVCPILHRTWVSLLFWASPFEFEQHESGKLAGLGLFGEYVVHVCPILGPNITNSSV